MEKFLVVFLVASSSLVIALFFLRLGLSSYEFVVDTLRKSRQDVGQLEEFRHALHGREMSELGVRDSSWQGTRKFVVIGKKYENATEDICSFFLAPYDRKSIPTYLPGQYLTLEFPIDNGNSNIMRCYSLSQSPTTDPQKNPQQYYQISVKKIDASNINPAGVVSNYLFNHVNEGSLVDVFAPAGEFNLDINSDRPIVFIAGGVGITPIISMINSVLQSGTKRQVLLFYCIRNGAQHAFQDHFNQLQRHAPNLRVITFYSAPAPRDQRGRDYQVEGRMQIEGMKNHLILQNWHFYVCCPPAMLRSVVGDLKSMGVADKNIKFEFFGSSGLPKAPPPEKTAAIGTERSFKITCAQSGKILQTSPDFENLLELAEANDIKARYGCRAGNCGSCKVLLRAGKVGYTQAPLRETEAGFCLPCIARAESDLVLDM